MGLTKKGFWPFKKHKDDESIFQFMDEPSAPVDPLKLETISKCIELAQGEIGDALISSAVAYMGDETTVVKLGCDDSLGNYSAQIIAFINVSATLADFNTGRYVFCELENHVAAFFAMTHDFVWTIIVDSSKMPVGRFLTMYFDPLFKVFKSAAEG
jgi:hypothetical protein